MHARSREVRGSVSSPTEVLVGLVERVTFHNNENGFCVLRVKARGQRDLITITGHAAMIAAGEFASVRLRRPEAMTRAAGGNLLALSLAAQAADEIKSGKWEFTTQMQLSGAVQSAPSAQAAGGNAPMTRIACI